MKMPDMVFKIFAFTEQEVEGLQQACQDGDWAGLFDRLDQPIATMTVPIAASAALAPDAAMNRESVRETHATAAMECDVCNDYTMRCAAEHQCPRFNDEGTSRLKNWWDCGCLINEAGAHRTGCQYSA